MNKSLFRYVWKHSRRDQLAIFAIVIASLPFYYVSLDLPRKIVNEAIQGRAFEQGNMTAPFLDLHFTWPRFLGGGEVKLFDGFEFGRLELLLALSFLFLFFVLVNGGFKYWINVAKGALGERMMRRLRFELFGSALRFTPEALKSVRSTEAATIIKDEVEPIGGFIGDAFIQPVFLGTQAATALLFILMQSLWLGLLAGAVVGVQFLIIPRMRRELLRLGRLRQIASRQFAGRVSEVIDGIEAVHVHDATRWERAEIGHRLYELFDIRFRIFKRKFIVKFLNNLLAQMTPFFFYSVGGYFALNGRLDIGQLVAVIAAYRELPPPLKELIDWDQQRLDVQVKYDQVVAYFAPEKLMSVEDEAAREGSAADDVPLAGPLVASDLQAVDPHGTPTLAIDRLDLTLPARLALVSDGVLGAGVLARILARRPEDFSGDLKLGERSYPELPAAVTGRRIAYAGTDPVIFSGSLRDNLLYGLRQRPVGEVEADEEERLRIREAKRTGNPVHSVAADWIDLERSGAADAAELDRMAIELLKRAGLEEDVYRFGLTGTVDPERQPALAEKLVEARERLRDKLREDGLSDLVEPFDPERYNTQATVAENLLFGVPTSRDLVGRALAENEPFRSVLDRAKLTDDLVRMGAQIAETMTDIFRDLPAGHPLFDQFSFVHADELAEFEEIVKRSRVTGRRGGLTNDDRTRLIALPLAYVEPRHRLGLIDDPMRDRLLETRAVVRAMLEAAPDCPVEFYDPDKLNSAAPVRDNLLFGRTNDGVANARDQVRALGAVVIQELELTDDIERVGLDHQVGPAGRLLTASQRATVNLIRGVLKRPDVMVVDGGLAPFGERRTGELLRFLLEATEGRTLAVVLPNEDHAELFEAVIRFDGPHPALGEPPAVPADARPAEPEPEAEEPAPDADPLPAAAE